MKTGVFLASKASTLPLSRQISEMEEAQMQKMTERDVCSKVNGVISGPPVEARCHHKQSLSKYHSRKTHRHSPFQPEYFTLIHG